MKLETVLFGYPITVSAQPLDEGWDISIIGGCKTHVGAVSMAAPGEPTQTIQRPEHKDAYISKVWAETLAKKWECPVCVCCGIHYDGADREQIEEIIRVSDRLLSRIGGTI